MRKILLKVYHYKSRTPLKSLILQATREKIKHGKKFGAQFESFNIIRDSFAIKTNSVYILDNFGV